MRVLRSDADPATPVRLTSSVGVADGNWHKITCFRAGRVLSIIVDNVVVGTRTLPAGFSITPTGQPFAVGANSAFLQNDQYHGDLDEVYFNFE